jgi:hypothetical protein
MISTLQGVTYSVLVTNEEVIKFASSWPCHGLDLDAEYLFDFDARNGDIADITVLRSGLRPDTVQGDEDGEALRVLSEDAALTGAEELELRDVIFIRFGEPALAL